MTPVSSCETITENRADFLTHLVRKVALHHHSRNEPHTMLQGQQGWRHLSAAEHWRRSMPRSHSPLAKTDRNANISLLLKMEKSLLKWQNPAATNSWWILILPLGQLRLVRLVKTEHHFAGVRGGVQKYHVIPPKAKWEVASCGGQLWWERRMCQKDG